MISILNYLHKIYGTRKESPNVRNCVVFSIYKLTEFRYEGRDCLRFYRLQVTEVVLRSKN